MLETCKSAFRISRWLAPWSWCQSGIQNLCVVSLEKYVFVSQKMHQNGHGKLLPGHINFKYACLPYIGSDASALLLVVCASQEKLACQKFNKWNELTYMSLPCNLGFAWNLLQCVPILWACSKLCVNTILRVLLAFIIHDRSLFGSICLALMSY